METRSPEPKRSLRTRQTMSGYWECSSFSTASLSVRKLRQHPTRSPGTARPLQTARISLRLRGRRARGGPLNSATVANGSHTLAARARDAAGNQTTSAPVGITTSNVAPDTQAPSVSLTAPLSGATVSGAVTVSANASDNVGVVGVQFLLDGAALGAEDTSASPYSATWNTTTAASGAHTLTAVARDAAGNVATSVGVGVTVAN